ncbi:hypothetical protein K491DRAFT_677567 [Lophiostoma macrostomum CBS 122681]|uniref:Uncharacterized protein n=1 Tax=Lophiostoma macrostomum CBS 122681 TaxID=1314788 RepID=A0A6A6TBR6_9PLEO|nr:hypothetical protein K491DRAFT_677567 [Lophiostoma macrostomum CBS 122681]
MKPDTLVFTTTNLTPENWATFLKDATIYWDSTKEPKNKNIIADPLNSYMLVHSRSQQDFDNATRELPTTVTTEFESSSWVDIKDVIIPPVAFINTTTIQIVP